MSEMDDLLRKAESATGAEREALLQEAGVAAGRAVQARIVANRNTRAPSRGRWPVRKYEQLEQPNIYGCGMESLEYVVGEQAKDAAIRALRETWLPTLERRLAAVGKGLERSMLAKEVRRLRRCLGVRPSPDTVRAQGRERVRKHRAAMKQV